MNQLRAHLGRAKVRKIIMNFRNNSDSHIIKTGTLGVWNYVASETEDKDWSFYSKAWHRSYGPKITTIRHIEFTRLFRGKIKSVAVEPSGWRGDFIVAAAIELGLIKPVVSKYPLRVRLTKFHDATLISNKRGYKIYSRKLAKTHVDYVIESPLGMIYHDVNRANLVKGLHAKIRAASKRIVLPDSKKIDWVVCKSLGFCDAGIKAFCSEFGFNPKSAYLPEIIEKAVRSDMDAAAPFLAELKTLAHAINYKIA